MKKDLQKIREIAGQRLDRVMASINPNVGYSIGADNVAFLYDVARRRLILDREPDERERAALAAYTMEILLRSSDEFLFELDNQLYVRELSDDSANYVRYRFNPVAIKWESEIISLETFIAISNYVEAHTPSPDARAEAARADVKRLFQDGHNRNESKVTDTGTPIEG